MPKRKLTPKLKDFLYENRWKAKLSDYDGEALAYLIRLRAASKAAKKRKANTAKVGAVKIPRNSRLYALLEKSAQIKGQSVRDFINENKDAVERLKKGDRIVISRETSYAVEDIQRLPQKSKIYINGDEVTKGDAVFALQSLTSAAKQLTDTAVINFEMAYDLKGNLHLDLPTDEELEYAELDESGDAMYELLENSEGFVSLISTGKGGKKK